MFVMRAGIWSKPMKRFKSRAESRGSASRSRIVDLTSSRSQEHEPTSGNERCIREAMGLIGKPPLVITHGDSRGLPTGSPLPRR